MGTVPRAKGGLRSCTASEERGPPHFVRPRPPPPGYKFFVKWGTVPFEMGTVPRAKAGLRSCAAAEERGPPVRHMPMMDWGRQFPRGSLTDHLS